MMKGKGGVDHEFSSCVLWLTISTVKGFAAQICPDSIRKEAFLLCKSYGDIYE